LWRLTANSQQDCLDILDQRQGVVDPAALSAESLWDQEVDPIAGLHTAEKF
jgi:hypothetical protein